MTLSAEEECAQLLCETGGLADAAWAMREATEITRTSWSSDELLAAEFPPEVWIVPGLVPAGLVSLAGRPKLGKSWLALQLSVAVASGGQFLGREVEAGPVLYLALEDGPRRLKKRLQITGAPAGMPLHFETEWPSLRGKATGLEALAQRVDETNPRLVVVDTLSRAFRGGVDWNHVGITSDDIGAMQTMALRRDLCLLCVDHHRKPNEMETDLLNDILGSTGKTMALDTAFGLYRRRGETRATLKFTSRDLMEDELAIEFVKETATWRLLGDARQAASDAAQQQVLDALSSLGEADAGAVASEAGISRQAARKHLLRLCARGDADKRMVNVERSRKVLFFPKVD